MFDKTFTSFCALFFWRSQKKTSTAQRKSAIQMSIDLLSCLLQFIFGAYLSTSLLSACFLEEKKPFFLSPLCVGISISGFVCERDPNIIDLMIGCRFVRKVFAMLSFAEDDSFLGNLGQNQKKKKINGKNTSTVYLNSFKVWLECEHFFCVVVLAHWSFFLCKAA